MKKFFIFILVVIGGIALYIEYVEKPRKNVDSGYYDNSESDEDVNSDVSENSEENSVSQDEKDFQDAFKEIKNEEPMKIGGNEINLYNDVNNEIEKRIKK